MCYHPTIYTKGSQFTISANHWSDFTSVGYGHCECLKQYSSKYSVFINSISKIFFFRFLKWTIQVSNFSLKHLVNSLSSYLDCTSSRQSTLINSFDLTSHHIDRLNDKTIEYSHTAVLITADESTTFALTQTLMSSTMIHLFFRNIKFAI